jgi:cellulose biosynthesis protein BcsQ
MKPKIISAALKKGGVAKTTTAHALASYLSKDHKVLLRDNDPQRSLTIATVDTSQIRFTSYDVIQNKVAPAVAVEGAVHYQENEKNPSFTLRVSFCADRTPARTKTEIIRRLEAILKKLKE